MRDMLLSTCVHIVMVCVAILCFSTFSVYRATSESGTE